MSFQTKRSAHVGFHVYIAEVVAADHGDGVQEEAVLLVAHVPQRPQKSGQGQNGRSQLTQYWSRAGLQNQNTNFADAAGTSARQAGRLHLETNHDELRAREQASQHSSTTGGAPRSRSCTARGRTRMV